MEEIAKTLIYIMLPSSIVLYGVYVVVKSFLSKEMNIMLLNMREKNRGELIPLRLAAYERMSLFLERTTMPNLVRRLNDPAMKSAQFHQFLLFEIREEFAHNVSQQIYMSDESWQLIVTAMEETIATINNISGQVRPDGPAQELAMALLQNAADQNHIALKYIKDEIRQVF